MSASAVLEYDPYDYAVQDDPFPYYTQLRTLAPLYHNETHGFWALSRHRDIVAAFRDESTFSNSMGVSLDPTAWGPNAHYAMSFLAMDPPDQTRLRALVSRGFTPRRVRDLEPQIRGIAAEYLDECVERGSFDLIDDFAGKLPMDVISELVGVPESDRAELRRLSDLLVHREEGSRDVPVEGVNAAVTLFGYYADLLAERRRAPKDDLTSALAAVADNDGDRLADNEIIAFLFLMIVAGNETTTKLLGNCAHHGARNADQLQSVLAAPERIPQWVEETLRFDASTQALARYLLKDLEIDGTVAPAGSQLLLLIGSGNRDEDVFPAADQFDINRDTTQLISFGGGRHYCLGANLARLEANIALEELVARVRDLDVDHERSQRVHSINVRGFAHLPVTVTPR
ncbi:MAG TPA: cytochrome P450 [Jatrophihabitantaceae bacterium]|nr:cytochrome P450 [Jatrophihabitantaceae bacterium]